MVCEYCPLVLSVLQADLKTKATVGMCALLFASVFWMRRKQYELFLILHILLSILVLITMLG